MTTTIYIHFYTISLIYNELKLLPIYKLGFVKPYNYTSLHVIVVIRVTSQLLEAITAEVCLSETMNIMNSRSPGNLASLSGNYMNIFSVVGGFLKWGYLQIIHFNGIFHYKPTILGIPHFWKPLYLDQFDEFPMVIFQGSQA